ncbi:MAG: DUF2188 domain-containing protein [Mycoplasma sp.]|nr:DUF2188 domain-containing protein [Mycoplasma sp.]
MKQNKYIIKYKDKKWAVKNEGSDKISKIFDSQTTAIKYAANLKSTDKVMVKNSKGEFREMNKWDYIEDLELKQKIDKLDEGFDTDLSVMDTSKMISQSNTEIIKLIINESKNEESVTTSKNCKIKVYSYSTILLLFMVVVIFALVAFFRKTSFDGQIPFKAFIEEFNNLSTTALVFVGFVGITSIVAFFTSLVSIFLILFFLFDTNKSSSKSLFIYSGIVISLLLIVTIISLILTSIISDNNWANNNIDISTLKNYVN